MTSAQCDLEFEFNKLKELTQNISQLDLVKVIHPNFSCFKVIYKKQNHSQTCPEYVHSLEVVGDGDSPTRHMKDIEHEVGHVWLEVEAEVHKSIENQKHESQYNLDKDSEPAVSSFSTFKLVTPSKYTFNAIQMVANDILNEIIAMMFVPSVKTTKLNKNLFKYAAMFNSTTAGVKRSFGIHNLHRRFTKHGKTSTEGTTVELTTSNPDFGTTKERDSAEDMNKIELSEIEVLA